MLPIDAESLQKIIWLVLVLLFAGVEAASVGLTSVWFAAGSLCALLAALLGAPLWIQIALFLVVSVLCLLAVRPLARRHINSKVEPTNADRVIGEQAQVTEDIDNIHGKGAVIIRGVAWTARSEDGLPVPTGALVKVLRIEGVKVFVERVPVEAGAKPEAW